LIRNIKRLLLVRKYGLYHRY